MNERRDDLQEIIDKALEEMAAEAGEGFSIDTLSLAEFCRRTGLTRSRARTIRKHGFRALPHGNSGRKAGATVLTGHTGLVDDQPGRGVTNSQVIYERLLGQGYRGGLTSVKTYIAAHRDLVPAPRRHVAPQGGRSQRFRTGPGEAYQMDWGFASVENREGSECRIACFAMVCHHCGTFYVEFFPNARQENLTMGMPRAPVAMGAPDEVPADDMRSVAARTATPYGSATTPPLWSSSASGPGPASRVTPSKAWPSPAPPGPTGMRCCGAQGRREGGAGPWYACPPTSTTPPAHSGRPTRWRSGSARGGRQPSTASPATGAGASACRAGREGSYPRIHGDDLSLELAVHAAAWDGGDSWREGQWAGDEPCELPSQRPTATIAQAEPPTGRSAFAKSGLGRCARGSRPTGAAPGLPDDRGNAWRLWTGDGSRGGAYARRGPRPDGAPERLRDEGSRQDGPREQGGDPGYFGSRPANAYLEGANSLTRPVKRAARGFRNAEYLATAILPGLGGLSFDALD